MDTKVTFLVPTQIQFKHDTWKLLPCPGAELAVIHTARALACEQNLRVAVVSRSVDSGQFDGVKYSSEFESVDQSPGITVHVRDYNARPDPREGHHVLWIHDTSREICSLLDEGVDLRDVLKRFDGLVFVSEWHKTEVLSAAGLTETELEAVAAYHPLPAAPRGIEKQRARLIHTAHPRKAIHHVLDAFVHVVKFRPDAELVLCGHPSIYQQAYLDLRGQPVSLLNLVDGLPSHVRARIEVLPNSLPQQQLLREVARAEILLHPDTSVETGATTVLEAMAVGTIPVVSDLGCLPELCWQRGLVVSTINRSMFAESVADATIALLNCEKARSSLAREAVRFADLRSTQARICEPWLRLFGSIRGVLPTRAPVQGSRTLVYVDTSGFNTKSIRKSWEEFETITPDAWVTHSPLWYDECEQSLEGGTSTWELVCFEGEVIGISPLVQYNDTSISGAIEPSGPITSCATSFNDAREIADAIVSRLEARATHDQRTLVVRFGILGKSGLPAQIHHFIQPLTSRDFQIVAQQAHVFRQGWNWKKHASRRLRTQIRSVSKSTEVVIAQSASELRTAFQLYSAHSENKMTYALTWEALRSLHNAGRLETRLCLVRGIRVGFSYSLISGDTASVMAWGVTKEALREGAAKVLIADTIKCLLSTATVVEVGTVYETGEFADISEFYRRLGGGRASYLVAQKNCRQRSVQHSYPVV